jgi:hypothetical protein
LELYIDAAKLPVNGILKEWGDVERAEADEENATNC